MSGSCGFHVFFIFTIILAGFLCGSFGLVVQNGGLSNSSWPRLIPLIRESVPVLRGDVVISHKTTYSGTISVGTPRQEFNVVFDTGSAHIVLPSSNCRSESCLMHRRYNLSQSSTSLPINLDGSLVPEDELCDQVTIGYGTGTVTGEFAQEMVCLGLDEAPCVQANIVMAVEMTPLPFKTFSFDGIFGLGLDSLAMTPSFSFLHRMPSLNSTGTRQFGVFLTDGEGGDQSEIALGGYNSQRLLRPLEWAPVAQRKLGYWRVKIKEIRIGGHALDVCADGTCRAIVDTGTSHIGIPGPNLHEIGELLSVDAHSDSEDCREARGDTLELVLDGVVLRLTPENYMRPLPLAVGTGSTVQRTCAPRIMPVNLPAPLGPKLFVLGEPLLHRYYTVYDWDAKRIGFGEAASYRNLRAKNKEQEIVIA